MKETTVTNLAILAIVFAVVGAVLLVVTTAFWALWNWIAVGVFGGPALTFWQAGGLVLLLSIVGNFFRSSSGGRK